MNEVLPIERVRLVVDVREQEGHALHEAVDLVARVEGYAELGPGRCRKLQNEAGGGWGG